MFFQNQRKTLSKIYISVKIFSAYSLWVTRGNHRPGATTCSPTFGLASVALFQSVDWSSMSVKVRFSYIWTNTHWHLCSLISWSKDDRWKLQKSHPCPRQMKGGRNKSPLWGFQMSPSPLKSFPRRPTQRLLFTATAKCHFTVGLNDVPTLCY